MYEIDKKAWHLAIMEATNTLSFEVINKLLSIARNGAEDIEKWAVPYIDMLYPYLPSNEQKMLKEYIKEKFDMIEMKRPTKQEVEMVRKEYPVGTRVELLEMDDIQAPPIRTQGTVKGVDGIGSLLVAWDNGSSLNVLFRIDKVKKV